MFLTFFCYSNFSLCAIVHFKLVFLNINKPRIYFFSLTLWKNSNFFFSFHFSRFFFSFHINSRNICNSPAALFYIQSGKNRKIDSHWKNISWNQLFTKNVAFTKSLSKICLTQILYFPQFHTLKYWLYLWEILNDKKWYLNRISFPNVDAILYCNTICKI